MEKGIVNPKVETKGSLLLAWQVKNKHCLVIGGGEVAFSRIEHMLRAQAKITVISGADKVHPEILKLVDRGVIYKFEHRDYLSSDLTLYERNDFQIDNVDLIAKEHYDAIGQGVNNETFAIVCCCIDDYELSSKIYYQCKYLRLPVNIADKPWLCDFYFGSMINMDNLQIMVSTNGKSPRLLKLIKDSIARQFKDVDLNKAVENLGSIRARLRETVVVNEDLVSIDSRMNWIKALTDFFDLRQWSQLDLSLEKVDKIVSFFPEYPPKDYDQFKSTILS
ncbi:uncharacterized protein PRCAT00004647001 [Priceomyces carsonii]|uniref:uncharacterized protein n=1 Tax=Priceomyces carsonii TaxID=28549 RepID=UPI002EDA3C82|nr:unnamed protein product [Priceomyces carsonii]